jgi:DNA-binding NarL/FixJ family response regulator
MHDESLYAERALKAGARGYVMKQEPQEIVMTPSARFAKGQDPSAPPCPPNFCRSFSGQRSSADLPPLARLTDRELEIFRLIGEGQSVRAIAEKLFLSTKTVEAHKEHIKQKAQSEKQQRTASVRHRSAKLRQELSQVPGSVAALMIL